MFVDGKAGFTANRVNDIFSYSCNLPRDISRIFYFEPVSKFGIDQWLNGAAVYHGVEVLPDKNV